MRHLSGLSIILVVLLATASVCVDVVGQELGVMGVTSIADWPEHRQPSDSGKAARPLNYSGYRMLPFIDTLAVHYRFSPSSSPSSGATVELGIEWVEGHAGILAGRKVDRSEMPRGIVIESVDLLMQVLVDGRAVADFFLPLDTVNLGPDPSIMFVDLVDVPWDSVFVDTDAETARQIVASGFVLSPPRILRITFAVDPTSEDFLAVNDGGPDSVGLREMTVCIPDIDLWIDWRATRSRWFPPPKAIDKARRNRRGEIVRTGLVGRTRANRGFDRRRTDPERAADDGAVEGGSESANNDESASSRDQKKGRAGRDGIGGLIDSKGEEDDDDDSLLPVALVGIAAVGGVALFGGTIGYFGSAAKAPLGLMSGYVEPKGGFLLHVAINKQVFGKAEGSENLVFGATSFLDVFGSPLQPAIGLGARLTEEGRGGVKWKPSVSVGLVGNLGRVVLLAGYDLTTPDVRFGAAMNFRYESQR